MKWGLGTLAGLAALVVAGAVLTWVIPIAVAVTALAIGLAWFAMRVGTGWATRTKDGGPDD